MTLLQEFEKIFGKTKIPQILKDFIAFAEEQDDFFAGDFELYPDANGLDTYEEYEEEEKKKKFFFFGKNGDGSGFAIWHYDDKALLEDSPISFWDSEGIDNIVIAANFKEFLSIIATEGEFSIGTFYEKEKDDDPSPGNKAFKKWLKEKYKLTPAKNPMELVVKARKNFPFIPDWFKGKADAFVKPTDKKTEIVKTFTTWDAYFKNNPEWFNIVGKKIDEYLPTDKMRAPSRSDKGLQYAVEKDGIQIFVDANDIIHTIFLTIEPEYSGDPIYKGPLPKPIERKMMEKEVIKLLGKPTKQDKKTDWSWIRYDKFYSYVLQIGFGKDEHVQLITLMDPVTGYFM